MLPPLQGSKKHVLKWRSKIIIVIAAANTGSEHIRSIAVTNELHRNTEKLIDEKVAAFMPLLKIVATKLIAPNKDDKPLTQDSRLYLTSDCPYSTNLIQHYIHSRNN